MKKEGPPATKGRLIGTGGFAIIDRITHHIPISTLPEIDDAVKSRLKEGCELDA